MNLFSAEFPNMCQHEPTQQSGGAVLNNDTIIRKQCL